MNMYAIPWKTTNLDFLNSNGFVGYCAFADLALFHNGNWLIYAPMYMSDVITLVAGIIL